MGSDVWSSPGYGVIMRPVESYLSLVMSVSSASTSVRSGVVRTIALHFINLFGPRVLLRAQWGPMLLHAR